jgi:hypothetical protein
MTVFRVLDDYIISESEYEPKQKELTAFFNERATGKKVEPFPLSGGRVLATTLPHTPDPKVPFTPLDRGKPLTIMIRDVYTGKYPGLLGDIAVVSGLKNFDILNAASRALNFLEQKQKQHTLLARPSAFSYGSALVAYSPAILTDSLTVSFELAVAIFPKALTDALSSAFSSLAGIPLLLPYAGYLLGGGQLLKLVGTAGHALFDGIRFHIDEQINFHFAGSVPTPAGFRILAKFDVSQFKYEDGKGIIDADGKYYTGDEPYIVISVDGAQNDDLKSFVPAVASADVLQRFFQAQDGAQVAVDTVVQGLQLVSDLKYRDQAQKLQAKLAAAPAADKPAIQQQLDAVLNNISMDALKPKP